MLPKPLLSLLAWLGRRLTREKATNTSRLRTEVYFEVAVADNAVAGQAFDVFVGTEITAYDNSRDWPSAAPTLFGESAASGSSSR